MKERPILWEPTAKQREFLSAPEREVLFGGAAGAAKTDGLLMAALSQAKNSRHQALILRRTFPQTRDLQRRSLEIFPSVGGIFNKGTSQWTFPGGNGSAGGAVVEFGYCDTPEDAFRYKGRAFSIWKIEARSFGFFGACCR
jgi:hypothetical protein